MQHQWLHEYVIPFLQDKYAFELRELDAWVEDHVGISIPLDLLAGDPRSTTKNNRIRINSFFDSADAFRVFVTDILNGKDLDEARFDYADSLHMAEKYDYAWRILDLLLMEYPDNVACITLKADICEHLEQYDQAIQYVEKALSIEKDYIDAYRVLSDAYEGLKLWDKVLEVTDKTLSLLDQDDILKRVRFLADRANAYIEMGNVQEANIILPQLEKGTKIGARISARLQEKMKIKGLES
jgi:tetratricopeptide (TPR) repeat protein